MNKDNKATINHHVRKVCEDLDIEAPKIGYLSRLNGHTQLATYEPEQKKMILKNFIGDMRDCFFAVAHELRHKYQIDKGLFDFVDYISIDNADIESFNMQDEELDAHAYATYFMIKNYGVLPKFETLPDNIKTEIFKRAEQIKIEREKE